MVISLLRTYPPFKVDTISIGDYYYPYIQRPPQGLGPDPGAPGPTIELPPDPDPDAPGPTIESGFEEVSISTYTSKS